MKRWDAETVIVLLCCATIGVIVAIAVFGCYPSLFRLPERQTATAYPLDVDGGAGENGTPPGFVSPPAVPWWSEDWFWQMVGGLGLAATSGLAARARERINTRRARSALDMVTGAIETRRNGYRGGVSNAVDGLVVHLKSLRASEPAIGAELHRSVKRSTK